MESPDRRQSTARFPGVTERICFHLVEAHLSHLFSPILSLDCPPPTSLYCPHSEAVIKMTNSQLQTLAILYKVSEATLAQVRKTFKTVHYHPDGAIPKDKYAEVEVWVNTGSGLPKEIKTLDEIPKTKLVQLVSAGANTAVTSDFMKANEGWSKQFALCTASGPSFLWNVPSSAHTRVSFLSSMTEKSACDGKEVDLHKKRADAQLSGFRYPQLDDPAIHRHVRH